MFKDIDLSAFPPERREKLETIYRYDYFDVLLYRSNLWMHTQRVLWLVEELAPLAQKHLQFDIEKARTLALVHDDAEIITGDMGATSKLRMSEEEQAAYEEGERRAIDQLLETYPAEINSYSYRELLESAVKKDSPEAQLVSYADKLDGYCESLHEVYAGNLSLLRSVVFYASLLPLFSEKYPALKSLLSSRESPLTHLTDQVSPDEIKFEKYLHLNKPHARETIERETDFPFYERWKKIVIENGQIEWLINQKEVLPQ